jgi:hypothetical protein
MGVLRIFLKFNALKNSEGNGMVFAFPKLVDCRRCDLEGIKEIKRVFPGGGYDCPAHPGHCALGPCRVNGYDH